MPESKSRKPHQHRIAPEASPPRTAVSRETAPTAPQESVPAAAIVSPAEFQSGFSVSRETLDRFALYEDLLARWQKTINLIAPKTLPEIWHRHFADSAQLYPLIPHQARHLLDLGSGGGFPGLVLAILAAGDPARASPETRLAVTLVESDTRKAAFLRETARALGIAVDILSSRIESIHKSDTLQPVDVITSRALAPLPRLLELMAPLFGPGTCALLLKGRAVAGEVDEARRNWKFDLILEPSRTDPEARIAVVRQLQRLQPPGSPVGAKKEGG